MLRSDRHQARFAQSIHAGVKRYFAQNPSLARVRAENVRMVRFLYCDNGNIIRGKASHYSSLADNLHSGIGLTVAMQGFAMTDIPPKRQRVYLSGAIEHASDGGTGWRRQLASFLEEELGHEAYDPAAQESSVPIRC